MRIQVGDRWVGDGAPVSVAAASDLEVVRPALGTPPDAVAALVGMRLGRALAVAEPVADPADDELEA